MLDFAIGGVFHEHCCFVKDKEYGGMINSPPKGEVSDRKGDMENTRKREKRDGILTSTFDLCVPRLAIRLEVPLLVSSHPLKRCWFLEEGSSAQQHCASFAMTVFQAHSSDGSRAAQV